MSTEISSPIASRLTEGSYEDFIAGWDHAKDGYLYAGAAPEPPGVTFHRDLADELDPITYEVLRHALWRSTDEHATACRRGSGSPIVVFGHDYCPALLTEDAEYVYVAAQVTFLGNTSQAATRWVLEHLSENPGIEDGDMFATNDPWICGLHQQDTLLICPVFVDGKLFCWVTNSMHQYDVGGNTPGSFCAGARDVHDEGMVMPPVKIVERGVLRSDIEGFYLRHSRMPHMMALDLRAEISGCSVARDRILGLVERYGAGTIKAAMRRIIDDSERTFLERLGRLPDGVFSERGYLEGGFHQSRETHRVVVNVTKDGQRLIFDNDGCDPAVGCLNATLAGWRGAIATAVMVTFCYDLQYAIGGPFRHIELRPVPGTLCAAPYPYSTSNTMSFLRATGAAVQAVSRMLITDERQRENIFTHPSICGAAAAIPISGIDQRGEPFANLLLEIQSGGRGAFSFRDGIPTGGPIYDVQGAMPNVEHTEQHMPLLYLFMRELADSGGVGTWARGNSLEVGLKLHEVDEVTVASVSADVAVSGTPGLYGGYPGVTNRAAWHKGTDVEEALAAGEIPQSFDELGGDASPVPPVHTGETWTRAGGDVLQYRMCGSAGYGDPLRRTVDLIEEDLELGYVSREAAETLYGVVFERPDADAIDAEATAQRRAEIRAERIATFQAPARRLDGAQDVTTPRGEGVVLMEVVEARLAASGEVLAACRDCGTAIGPAYEPIKDWLPAETLPSDAFSPIQGPAEELVDGGFEFRRWCCPGCGVLVDCEVMRSDDAPLANARLVPGSIEARLGNAGADA